MDAYGLTFSREEGRVVYTTNVVAVANHKISHNYGFFHPHFSCLVRILAVVVVVCGNFRLLNRNLSLV